MVSDTVSQYDIDRTVLICKFKMFIKEFAEPKVTLTEIPSVHSMELSKSIIFQCTFLDRLIYFDFPYNYCLNNNHWKMSDLEYKVKQMPNYTLYNFKEKPVGIACLDGI